MITGAWMILEAKVGFCARVGACVLSICVSVHFHTD